MQQLTAKDIMSSPVVSVGANDKLTQVERLLVKAKLNGAPVLENGNIVGMVSRSDFVPYRYCLSHWIRISRMSCLVIH